MQEKKNLSILIDPDTSPTEYSNALYNLGEELGKTLVKQISNKNKRICVACTVEDADNLAEGIINILTNSFTHISLACFWNQREYALSIAPILRKYKEPEADNADILIVVKSVISSACVIKTNLTNLIQNTQPEKIFVVAPVIYVQAPESLEKEFPLTISKKFQYLYLAKDTTKEDNGNLVPGIGGNLYQRLGFEGQDEKNRYTPQLIKGRRKLFSNRSQALV